MTHYKFGDLVVVPFPFTDQTGTKKRPAVVISSDSYNELHLDIVLMAITGRIRSPLIVGEIKVVGWKEAGLLKSSVIKPIFTTVEKDIVLKRLGKLNENDAMALRDNLQNILG